MRTGKVYLVGAGPGDPDLITVKGFSCLKKADVIIYDRLANESLLDVAPPEAERIDVGKAAGEHTLPQGEINNLLAAKAKEGKTVVRLKGGDPFVLGRGGEEGEVLQQQGVPFEVVPGITSAIAVPAYAGIPVTHRGVSSSFAVVTGHEDPTKASSSIDWAKLATGVDTLVFLMGLGNLAEIVAELVKNGRPPGTPVAVVCNGTYPEQATVIGDLQDIAEKVKERRLASPAIIVVGEVVRLREKLRWFDCRPLFGKRVLVTRATHQASTLSQLLAERGAQAIELPAIDIQPVTDSPELRLAISNLKQYRWLILTSVNAVAAFWQQLDRQNLDSRALSGVRIAAIGQATAQALEAKGIIPDLVPEVSSGEGIIAALKEQNIAGQRFLLPRADIADEELVEGIVQSGGLVDAIVTYRTVPATEAIARAKEALLGGKIDVVTFTSSSTVTNLVAAFADEPLAVNRAKVACIGPKTAETAVKAGLKVDILAQEQTIPGLVIAIEEYFKKET